MKMDLDDTLDSIAITLERLVIEKHDFQNTVWHAELRAALKYLWHAQYYIKRRFIK